MKDTKKELSKKRRMVQAVASKLSSIDLAPFDDRSLQLIKEIRWAKHLAQTLVDELDKQLDEIPWD